MSLKWAQLVTSDHISLAVLAALYRRIRLQVARGMPTDLSSPDVCREVPSLPNSSALQFPRISHWLGI